MKSKTLKKFLPILLSLVLLVIPFAGEKAFADPNDSTHKVTFDTNEYDPTPATQQVAHGGHAKEPSEYPDNPYQTFLGWMSDPNGTEQFDFKNTAINDDTTIYARYGTYLKYKALDLFTGKDKAGGMIMTSFDNTWSRGFFVPAYNGVDVTLTAKPDVGYIFRGWFKSDGTVLTYGETFTYYSGEDKEVELIAKFDKCHVTFECGEGATKVPAMQSVAVGEKATRPTVSNEPIKDGYYFYNWYADKECTTLFDFSKPITEDTKIYAGYGYAIWASTWNINSKTYDTACGTVHVNDAQPSSLYDIEIVPQGEEVTMTAEAKSGYRFVKWSPSDGKLVHDWPKPTGETVSTDASYTFTPTANTWLYAMFEKAWLITFDADGGTTTNEPTYADYDSEYTLPSADTFTAPEGKRLKNYAVTAGDGKQVTKNPGDKIKVTADTKVKAQWEDKAHKVNVFAQLNCKIKLTVQTAEAGETVSFQVTPDEFHVSDTIYAYQKGSMKPVQITESGETPLLFTFTMPDSDVNIVAICKVVEGHNGQEEDPTEPAGDTPTKNGGAAATSKQKKSPATGDSNPTPAFIVLGAAAAAGVAGGLIVRMRRKKN